jgi:NTP pyrophosphatase (non-canonical NTP hydrolase)
MTDDREEIARLIALAGLGTSDGYRRGMPENWGDEAQWKARILECIPTEAAERCFELADAILARAQGPGPGEAVAWRPEIVAFANLMEAKLRANDHKGGWRNDRAADLHSRLLEEAEELFDALNWRSAFLGAADPERIGSEAADVANFAMMIADVCGALDATPTREV